MKKMFRPVLLLVAVLGIPVFLFMLGRYFEVKFDQPNEQKYMALKPRTERYFLEKDLVPINDIGSVSNLVQVGQVDIDEKRQKIKSVYATLYKDDFGKNGVNIYYFLDDGVVYYINKTYELENYTWVSSKIVRPYLEIKWQPLVYSHFSDIFFTMAFIIAFVYLLTGCYCIISIFKDKKRLKQANQAV